MASFPIVGLEGEGEDGGEAMERMRSMFGPGMLDQQLRQAFSMCWMGLPKERRSVAEVEKEMRRLFERVVGDLKEDARSFGMPE